MNVIVQDVQNASKCENNELYATGAIDIEITSGVPPYVYEWSNGEMTQDIESLNAGTYTVTVTDDAGCAAEFSVEVCCCIGDQLPNSSCSQTNFFNTQINISGGVNYIFNDAILETQVTGGTGNYICNWTGPNGYISSNCEGLGGFQDGLDYGTYCLQVDDGCSEAVQCYEIVDCSLVNDLSLSADITGACGNFCNGIISITGSGGTPPYSFSPFSSTISACPNTQYCITITDANGCNSQECFAVQGNASSNIERVDCIDYTYCNGELVDILDWGVTSQVDPLDCRFILTICGDGMVLARTPTETTKVYNNDCSVTEFCTTTGEIFNTVEHSLMSKFESGENTVDDCYWCHTITWCTDGTESWNKSIMGGIGIKEDSTSTECNEDKLIEVYCDLQQPPIGTFCGNGSDATNCTLDDFFNLVDTTSMSDEFKIITYDTIVIYEKNYKGELVKFTRYSVRDSQNISQKYLNENFNHESLDTSRITSSSLGLFFEIYPNPASDLLNIKTNYESLNIEKIVIYDISGKLVESNNGYNSRISLQNLESGMYFVSMVLNSGMRLTEKFIKL